MLQHVLKCPHLFLQSHNVSLVQRRRPSREGRGLGLEPRRALQLTRPSCSANAPKQWQQSAKLKPAHGRTRAQKCTCVADWGTIRAIKNAVSIPVLANGGIERPEDLDDCLAATQCDGVMTSEGALENPALLGGVPTSRAAQAATARQYVALARAHPPRCLSILKAHFFKLLYMALAVEANRDLRERLGAALDAEGVFGVVGAACEREEAAAAHAPAAMSTRCDEAGAPFTSWYRRHRGATAAPSDRYGGAAPALEEGRDTCAAESQPPCG